MSFQSLSHKDKILFIYPRDLDIPAAKTLNTGMSNKAQDRPGNELPEFIW